MYSPQVTGLQGLVSKSGVQASGFFKRHYEQTLPGLASKMRTGRLEFLLEKLPYQLLLYFHFQAHKKYLKYQIFNKLY